MDELAQKQGQDARNLVQDLAMNGKNAESIVAALRDAGLDEHISFAEIDKVMREATLVGHLNLFGWVRRERVIRGFGAVVCLAGVVTLILGYPLRLSLTATILGFVLIWWPEEANTEL